MTPAFAVLDFLKGSEKRPSPWPDAPLENGPYLPNAAPRHDVMRRDRLPWPLGMELELRQWSTTVAADLAWVVATLSRKLTKVLLWNAVLAPVSIFLAPLLDSPILIPVWIGLALFQAKVTLEMKEREPGISWTEIYASILIPLLLPIVLTSVYAPSFLMPRKLGALVCVLTFLAFVADAIITHSVYYLTADLKLDRDAALFRRGVWTFRFQRGRLLAAARSLEQYRITASAETACAPAPSSPDVELLHHVADYPFGFLILVLYGVLLVFGTFAMQLVVPPLLTLLFVAVKWRSIREAGRLVARTILPSFLNWLSWGRLTCESTPGLFFSRFGPSVERLAVTCGAFWVVSAMFLENAFSWSFPAATLRGWMWGTFAHILLLFIYPVLVVLTVCTAVGGVQLGLIHREIGGRIEGER